MRLTAIRIDVVLVLAWLASSSLADLGVAHESAKKAKGPSSASGPSSPSSAAPAPGTPGSIGGRVTLLEKDGPKPAESALVFIEEVKEELWKDRPVKGGSGSAAPAPGKDASMTMSGKQFTPRVLPVLVGQEVHFPNLDPVHHNVFSLTGKNKFDLGLYKDGASKTKTFTAPGVVRVFCNIHPKMTGYLVVLQNPWSSKLDAEGHYTLADVPPGHYTVKAWDEKGGELEKEVDVKAGTPTVLDFVLDASGFRELPHKNKFGQEYGTAGY